jgi:glycosyltransferase involved in cell wall biosynthesis
MFEMLAREAVSRGWSLTVHFMADSEPHRAHWNRSLDGANFAYRIWGDYPIILRGKVYHFNPSLILHAWRLPSDALLVGGPWDSLTGIGISFSARAPIKVGWTELNLHSPGRRGPAMSAFKRLLLSRYTHFAVPGSEGKAVLAAIAGRAQRPVVTLPNIVDERRFSRSQPFPRAQRDLVRKRYGLDAEARLAVWPARLIPAKNVLEIVRCLEPVRLLGSQIAIFGTGPDEVQIKAQIAERGLADHVRLLGLANYEEMPDIYGAADLFLLPSSHDPNPLSVIEAMFAGLPILVSKQIGNFPEALIEGANGWGVDAANVPDIMSKLTLAISTPAERLKSMGQASTLIAKKLWDSENCARDFFDALDRNSQESSPGL